MTVPAIEIDALIERLVAEKPHRELSVAVALALGWTVGPSRSGWKVVPPFGGAGGTVAAPASATEAAEVWFDPQGQERGLVGRPEVLPPWLTSIDGALSAATLQQRGQVLYHAFLAHAGWQLDHGVEDAALDRLPAFIIAEVLEGAKEA